MTGAEIMGAVGFFVLVFGFIFGLWKYVDAKISAAKTEASAAASAASAMASLAREELAQHKTHVAETYATKAGMQEQTAQLLRAIEGIGNRIESMNERLDRAFENQPRPRSRAS
ncbi:hypothetical protein [Agrobacterium tumefaciens]|uniref:hypothetical protein n=1 Tax=Agrobacterium tumefaciens TaxID=358 RepID=UPI0027879DE4|nr:hypothetical protein [Agrobacterium tumefaciens]MDP9854484.1 flagellar biosynthesis/type III secretory pathway M-ring protein FliF/YscJ [Agrobacterium tumefaciens]